MDISTAFSVVETCYKIGAQVVQICATWKNANIEFEQRVVIVDACWTRTEHQVNFMLLLASLMSDNLRRILNDLLAQLSISLSLAINTMETVGEEGSLGVWKKEALYRIICDLEKWRDHFDSSWFLLMKIVGPLVDRELANGNNSLCGSSRLTCGSRDPVALASGLRKALSLRVEQSRSLTLIDSPMQWLDIPFSSAEAARRVSSNDCTWYIVDTIDVNRTARVRDVYRDVRILAAKLSQAEPLVFGLLNYKGVIGVPHQHRSPTPSHGNGSPSRRNPEALVPFPQTESSQLRIPSAQHLRAPSPSNREFSQFWLVFQTSEGMEVLQSLRQLLLDSDAKDSLSRKIRIYVHTFAFVHKNLRLESILCFEDPNTSRSRAFLVGFNAFCASDTGTMMAGDMSWDRNVYRHPLRQGNDPAEKYRMQHDIYSLGVCLLEVGLWESFVNHRNKDEIIPAVPGLDLGTPTTTSKPG